MKKQKLEGKRFDYNMGLELVLRQVFGKTYYNSAGGFSNPSNIKKALSDWIRKIRKRTLEVTNYDLRLKEMILLELEYIEKEIKKINKENNDWKIIPRLMEIISRLLGYDWCDGEIHRQVFFFQNRSQEEVDEINKGEGISFKDYQESMSKVYKAQLDIIKSLEKKGLTFHEISCVLKISESTINRMKNREEVKLKEDRKIKLREK